MPSNRKQKTKTKDTRLECKLDWTTRPVFLDTPTHTSHHHEQLTTALSCAWPLVLNLLCILLLYLQRGPTGAGLPQDDSPQGVREVHDAQSFHPASSGECLLEVCLFAVSWYLQVCSVRHRRIVKVATSLCLLSLPFVAAVLILCVQFSLLVVLKDRRERLRSPRRLVMKKAIGQSMEICKLGGGGVNGYGCGTPRLFFACKVAFFAWAV